MQIRSELCIAIRSLGHQQKTGMKAAGAYARLLAAGFNFPASTIPASYSDSLLSQNSFQYTHIFPYKESASSE